MKGLRTVPRAAAAGGVTTIIEMPFDAGAPVNNLETFLRKKERVEKEAVVDVALLATIRKRGGLDQIQPLAEAGACGFKLSLFETDPERFPQIPDDELLEAFPSCGADRPRRRRPRGEYGNCQWTGLSSSTRGPHRPIGSLPEPAAGERDGSDAQGPRASPLDRCAAAHLSRQPAALHRTGCMVSQSRSERNDGDLPPLSAAQRERHGTVRRQGKDQPSLAPQRR